MPSTSTKVVLTCPCRCRGRERESIADTYGGRLGGGTFVGVGNVCGGGAVIKGGTPLGTGILENIKINFDKLLL